MTKYQSISIIIPVFNEAKTIKNILDKVISADALGLKKEIIVVDDGSTDGTRDVLKKFRKAGVKKFYLNHNQGKGAAVRVGILHSSGDIILVQDADLEYDPTDYPILILPFLLREVDAVFGSRELNINKHSYVSYFLGGKVVTIITRLLFGGRLTDVPTGYKLIRASLLKKLPLKCKRFEFCPELAGHLLKRRARIVEVPISYYPRTIAEGKKIKLRDGIEAILTLLRERIGL